jgi:hypothetical protein
MERKRLSSSGHEFDPRSALLCFFWHFFLVLPQSKQVSIVAALNSLFSFYCYNIIIFCLSGCTVDFSVEYRNKLCVLSRFDRQHIFPGPYCMQCNLALERNTYTTSSPRCCLQQQQHISSTCVILFRGHLSKEYRIGQLRKALPSLSLSSCFYAKDERILIHRGSYLSYNRDPVVNCSLTVGQMVQGEERVFNCCGIALSTDSIPYLRTRTVFDQNQ